jgi:hypothetical protein
VSELRAKVRALEFGAEPVHFVTRARLWHRIASSETEQGMHADAKHHFGRALDCYLEAGCFEAAAALCRRFIRLYPEVVRARCTLAFLSNGQHNLGDAAEEIIGYALAAKRMATAEHAVTRLRLMADATEDRSIQRCIANALRELGDEEGCRDVQHRSTQPTPQTELDRNDCWEKLMAIALLNREQLSTRREQVVEDDEFELLLLGS